MLACLSTLGLRLVEDGAFFLMFFFFFSLLFFVRGVEMLLSNDIWKSLNISKTSVLRNCNASGSNSHQGTYAMFSASIKSHSSSYNNCPLCMCLFNFQFEFVFLKRQGEARYNALLFSGSRAVHVKFAGLMIESC